MRSVDLEAGRISWNRLVDSPLPWGAAGFAIGTALGVNTLSVWLVAAGLGVFLVYLWLHGAARQQTEGWLFASGPVFMMAWLAGFVVRELTFG